MYFKIYTVISSRCIYFTRRGHIASRHYQHLKGTCVQARACDGYRTSAGTPVHSTAIRSSCSTTISHNLFSLTVLLSLIWVPFFVCLSVYIKSFYSSHNSEQQTKVKWRVDRISEKKSWSEVKWWEVLEGSEGVHYFGHKFGDGWTVLCLVWWCEVK
jgi:hypothetical protein